MLELIAIVMLVAVLAFLSGMLGIGGALVVAPILGLFGYALKNVIQPWALLLNGTTAIGSSLSFLRARLVDLRTAVPVSLICTLTVPIGVVIARLSPTDLIWWIYIAALVAVAIRMLLPQARTTETVSMIPEQARRQVSAVSAPIGVFSGFLGVGPGFLLVPAMTVAGLATLLAAATNSTAVILPSFAGFVTHVSGSHLDWTSVALTCAVGAATSVYGARFAIRHIPSRRLAILFAVVMIALAIERAAVLLA